MDNAPPPDDRAPAALPEIKTGAERHRNIAWEAKGIAEADAELTSGLYVEAAEINDWISSIGTGNEILPPPTRHR